MVKVVRGASLIMHKDGDMAKTIFPSLKSSVFRNDFNLLAPELFFF